MSDFAFPATLTTGFGVATVTALREGHEQPIYQADERHPHWEAILEGLRSGDESVWTLFDVLDGVMSQFQQVTDRVGWDGENILFDGDPVHSVLTEQLSRALTEGNTNDYSALAKFWEKLESNPNSHSREQAYDWLACHKFQITEDGDVVGYKYVSDNGDGNYTSCARSQVEGKPSGFVNGTAVPPLSVIPQKVGDVVTMPRSEVAHDPSQACKAGLHVGTFDYVGGGSSNTVLEVHVNPRDIVSVPTDGAGAKVRVCRYTVAALAGKVQPSSTPVKRDTYTWAGDVGTKVF